MNLVHEMYIFACVVLSDITSTVSSRNDANVSHPGMQLYLSHRGIYAYIHLRYIALNSNMSKNAFWYQRKEVVTIAQTTLQFFMWNTRFR